MSDDDLIVPLHETVQAHHEWASKADARIPLGFPVIDSRSGGPALGEVVMFLAYSGVGKTAWACNVVVNCRHVPTVFFSLEMQGHAVARRIAAIYTNTPTRQIELDDKFYGYSSALDQMLRDFPYLIICDRPGMSLKDMSKAMELTTKMWHGVRPRLVIIDFLELIKAPAMSAVEGIDNVSRRLHDWAREHDVVVVVLHQVNHAGGNGWEPLTRRAARYGGDTTADYTLGAYRPSLQPGAPQDGLFMLQFLKTRTGGGLHPTGVAHLFDEETLKIRPIFPR